MSWPSAYGDPGLEGERQPVPIALPLSDAERAALRRAVSLAAPGGGPVLPNPSVGCILLDPDGLTVGEGSSQPAGGPHAEIDALATAGDRARGATAVVTLEPCNHTGRTGPCTEALIAAGIRRVVVGVRDPWPVAAGGIERLEGAGIEVLNLAGTAEAADVEALHRVWLTAIRLGRPYVTFKAGMTMDGRVAAVDGSSRWITSEQSRADVHRLRAEVDTMMVGIGTVLADDPQLTARGADGQLVGRQPLRVVVDSTGRTPSTARVLDDAAPTLLATTAEFGTTATGRVDLPALLTALFSKGQRHVLVEGGPRLAAALFDAQLVDEVVIYQAPLVLGAGRSVVSGGSVTKLVQAQHFELVDIERFGPDVRLRWLRTSADEWAPRGSNPEPTD